MTLKVVFLGVAFCAALPGLGIAQSSETFRLIVDNRASVTLLRDAKKMEGGKVFLGQALRIERQPLPDGSRLFFIATMFDCDRQLMRQVQGQAYSMRGAKIAETGEGPWRSPDASSSDGRLFSATCNGSWSSAPRYNSTQSVLAYMARRWGW